jgi:N-acetylneuraminic acid mutarotase
MSNNSSTSPVLPRSAVARLFSITGKWLSALALVTVTAGFGSCSGGGGNAPNYVLQGSISGLLPGHSVALQNFGSDTTTVTANGSFQFNRPLAGGAPYSVTVLSQPTGENCAAANGSGTGMVGPGIKVTVVCTYPSFTIGGEVYFSRANLVLQLNGTDDVTVEGGTSSAFYQFTELLPIGTPYTVTVVTQPPGQSCTVPSNGGNTNGPATGIANSNVPDVNFLCVPVAYTIGGAVSGLSGGTTVVLQDNGGNSTTVAVNGAFTFSTSLAYQSPYAVTVDTQPVGESCVVTQGSGRMPAANVTDIAVACTPATVNAGLWTWESGSNTPEFAGVYGTLGTPAPGNVPGGREAAFSWTDSAGDLWMFGGIGAGNSGVGGSFNDLWRFSPSTGWWAWMGGANTLDAVSVYGTKGTAAVGNMPSAREGGAAWSDAAGNFWLFGGGGFDSTGSNGALNDLWRYSPSSGLWTWMNGPTLGNVAGVYGTQGTPAPGNVPGSRSALVSWKDNAGNFWLFGGAGFDSNDLDSYLNDLWRYNPSTNQWTWMGGSRQGDAAGEYGTQGTAAAANVPGARLGAVSWTDGSGNFWLFGGRGHDSNGTIGVLNDLWQYSPTTGRWTWMSGSMTAGAPGVYGTLGTAAAGNVPGARQDAVSWIDTAGNLWLFGDGTFDSGGNLVSADNDLWRYSPSTELWTWMGGSTTPGAAGVYGTEGVAAPGNVPPGRDTGLSWIDGAGNFWLFGGYVPSAARNDLWKYRPPVP